MSSRHRGQAPPPESVPPLMPMPPTASESAKMAATAGSGNRDWLAERLWTLADDLGTAKIVWRSRLTTAEREAADVITSAFLRLGGQAKRGKAVNDPSPGGWHYVFRVSPEGRPDPESGPDGPMTAAEALARETGPDPASGWRTVAVGVITAEEG